MHKMLLRLFRVPSGLLDVSSQRSQVQVAAEVMALIVSSLPRILGNPAASPPDANCPGFASVYLGSRNLANCTALKSVLNMIHMIVRV